MNKKQIGAMIRVLDSNSQRPLFKYAYIVKIRSELYLCGTDCYSVFALKLDDTFKEFVNKAIHVNQLKIWKLLAHRIEHIRFEEMEMDDADTSTAKALCKVITDAPLSIYKESKSKDKAYSFNYKYIGNMEMIDGNGCLIWNLNGNNKPMLSKGITENIYLVMPRTVYE